MRHFYIMLFFLVTSSYLRAGDCNFPDSAFIYCGCLIYNLPFQAGLSEVKVTTSNANDTSYLLFFRIDSLKDSLIVMRIKCSTRSNQLVKYNNGDCQIDSVIEKPNYIDKSGTSKNGSLYWREKKYNNGVTVVYENVTMNQLKQADFFMNSIVYLPYLDTD